MEHSPTINGASDIKSKEPYRFASITFMVPTKKSNSLFFLTILIILTACDHGLAPPEENARGAISGTLTYSGTWPARDSLREIRFVGMRFVPQDTADFLQLNRMVISDTLARYVTSDSFFIPSVQAGVYVYSGVAENFGRGILDWRPIELYTLNEGTFIVRGNETTTLSIDVDLSVRPPFPPDIDP
ncbi:MAG: hypothetical protein KTR29_19470 [Rhodothermaceae bacterium]|nr:hypothetical protein [Rhodothermaceae bacterium]